MLINWQMNTSCAVQLSLHWRSVCLCLSVCACVWKRASVCMYVCHISLVVQTPLSLLGGQPSCTLKHQRTHQEYQWKKCCTCVFTCVYIYARVDGVTARLDVRCDNGKCACACESARNACMCVGICSEVNKYRQ